MHYFSQGRNGVAKPSPASAPDDLIVPNPLNRGRYIAAANRNLEEEFDTLKAGLDTLRKDISSLVSSFGDAATD